MFEPDDLLAALTNAKVEFIIIGGIAVGVHGFVRATEDLDIVPDPAPENLARLARVLAEIGARHVGLGDFSSDDFPYDPTDPTQLAEGANFRLDTNHGALDILQWVAGIQTDPAYRELIHQATTVEFRGAQICVCGIEHLRAMKRAAGRDRDLADLRELGE
jgi:predicted nucleotidyltransferase